MSHYLIHSVNLYILGVVFRPFTFSVIIDMLGLNGAILCFDMCLFSVLCSSLFFFLSFCRLLEHSFWTYLLISLYYFECMSFITFLVIILGIAFYIHNLPQSTGIDIPIWVRCRKLTSLYHSLSSPNSIQFKNISCKYI